MRVLMPSRILKRHTGGNTTYARHIARGLAARGIDVALLPAADHPALTMLRETIAGLQRGQPEDILHYVADTGPLLRTRRPSVVTVHGVASRWISSARTPRQERVWRTRVQRAVDTTDHVITVSRSSAEDIQEVFGVESARLTTIDHGIDIARFAEPVELSAELKQRLPASFALYLGNLEPRKNIEQLVRAFQTPEVRALGVPLVVAGKPAWNAGPTMAAINEAPDVMYLGFVSDDDRAALMQSCTTFVFPSLYEGFGFPVLEALAAGTVVVTSDRGSLSDVAGPALRFESLELESVVDGIVRGISDDRARAACVEAGVAWASRFTWDASVDKHIEVYRSVAK